MNNIGTIPNGTAYSAGPSVGVSSLVTDANSCLSGGPQMQRSASINTESYMRLPASPMSFSSNNISGSSQVIDGSSIIQPSQHEDHMQKRRAASSSVTSQPLPPQKKSRADLRSQGEVLLQQQAMQQLHQNPQLQAMLQQQRLAQQQQMLQQAVPQMQRAQQIMQQQQQMRPQLMPQQPIQVGQAGGLVKNPSDSGLCFRRLMQYLYHKRQRPADNSISYWRKLVDEYFAPKARKRWCVSLYDNRGGNASNSFQQTSLDAWRCDICGAKSGKGFEATYEILPRLCQIKFDRGVMDEHLFLDMPHEYRLSSGIMVLEYAKAVQESVYEHVRVIHEGRLRIIFTPELKIISWEFCARRHEEFVPRRFIAPQVNHLIQVAQKYQAAVEGQSSAVSHQDTQAICNMFVSAGRQMMKNLELQLLNEHGFSKRYVRCLQISEVVNSMKDLIEFSNKNKMGPIDSLKSFASQNPSNLPAQNLQQDNTANQFMTVSNLPPTDHPSTSMNKMPGMHPEITNTAPPQQTSAIALSSYHNMLKSSMGANRNALPHEVSSVFNLQQNGMTGMTGMSGTSLTGLIQQPAQVNQQHLQHHVIQQLLQEVKNNSRPALSPAPPLVGQVPCTTNMSAGTGPTGMTGPNAHMMNRSSSFKSVGSNPTAGASTSNLPTPKPEVAQPMDLPELDQITDFADNGLFDSADGGYGWKM
ncbi:hypothetical protein LUZ61_020256 [Rhynchospora tenuis]|uniref:Transcriptional regulator SLK2 n=1 Tax=Rhynchospora tenuis TaxID=198213 RepID=A0AAD5ZCY9_9POAL|nr:hypothetical protein LUZ61_020256 [Rhynchospora tenuis]